MKKLILVSLVLVSTFAFAQKKGGKTTTTDKSAVAAATNCKIITAKGGERIKDGDIVFADMCYANSKDSILFDNKKIIGQPIQLMIGKSEFKGDLNANLKLLAMGDSAIIKINADSLFQKTFNQKLPPFIAPGSDLTFYVKILKVTNKEAMLQEQQAEAKTKQVAEEVNLEQYIADNKLTVTKTASGLRYIVTQAADGPKPETGKKVVVHYTGTLLNGKKFDSSVDRNEPFEFTLGVGQVIKGWDEGIALLNKGSKARLLIPSSLGYGSQGAGGSIGAYEPLIFDVELIDIK